VSRPRFPHTLNLLIACILIASTLTWIVPAGQFERRQDEATGRTVVVAGTYHAVEPDPVGPLEMMFAIPQGMIEAADVIFLVFLVGGAFAVVDLTGALRAALEGLVRRLGDARALVIPICAIAFAIGGITENMQEEIIALIPALLLLARRVGFDALTVVAMSLGAAMVGSAFSPINPFQVGIAQGLAQLPIASGWEFRTAFLLPALGIWIWATMRHARRVGLAPLATAAGPGAAQLDADAALADGPQSRPQATSHADPGPARDAPGSPQATPGTGRTTIILLLIASAFAVFIYGVSRLGWGFVEMAGVFFVMGLAAGLVGRLGINGTADAFVEGFRAMAFAALLIGFARAIYVVLNDGLIIDTIVHGLFTPLEGLPRTASVLGMAGVHSLIHVPVPSVSGHAVLTLPILVPLGDLLSINRQVIVLAYQFGAGLCDMLTPTNGALMAILAAAGVRYDRWLRFALPLWAALMALGAVALVVALTTGLS
jgi:uncharacterized ion transporter superfamily protein YfcC